MDTLLTGVEIIMPIAPPTLWMAIDLANLACDVLVRRWSVTASTTMTPLGYRRWPVGGPVGRPTERPRFIAAMVVAGALVASGGMVTW